MSAAACAAAPARGGCRTAWGARDARARTEHRPRAPRPEASTQRHPARCLCAQHCDSVATSRAARTRGNGRRVRVKRGALTSKRGRSADAQCAHRSRERARERACSRCALSQHTLRSRSAQAAQRGKARVRARTAARRTRRWRGPRRVRGPGHPTARAATAPRAAPVDAASPLPSRTTAAGPRRWSVTTFGPTRPQYKIRTVSGSGCEVNSKSVG